jgi:hypothetical protein
VRNFPIEPTIIEAIAILLQETAIDDMDTKVETPNSESPNFRKKIGVGL